MRGVQHTSTSQSGQVSAWLIRMLAIVAIVGFLAIEGGAVVINRVQVQDLAGEAAQEAGLTFSRIHGIDPARARAEEYVAGKAEVLDVTVNQAQTEITVTLRKTAHTFIIQKIEKLKSLTVSTTSETAPIRVG